MDITPMFCGCPKWNPTPKWNPKMESKMEKIDICGCPKVKKR